jgi:hypothetical protein
VLTGAEEELVVEATVFCPGRPKLASEAGWSVRNVCHRRLRVVLVRRDRSHLGGLPGSRGRPLLSAQGRQSAAVPARVLLIVEGESELGGGAETRSLRACAGGANSARGAPLVRRSRAEVPQLAGEATAWTACRA